MAGNRFAAPVTRVIGAAAVCFSLVACYTLLPTPGNTMPSPGTQIAMDLNDAGRTALGGLIGPSIGQIEGRLVGSEGTEYEVAVTTVRLLRGGEQVWNGERVKVKREYITQVYEKQFSKGRTVVASAVGIGVVTYFATRAIVGFLHGDDGMLPTDSAEAVRRPVRP
jgi:hypothetical protein